MGKFYDKNNPYSIIKSRYSTEKAVVLESLKNADSNKCVARCQSPKYVFLVEKHANKKQITEALEEIYKEQNIKVVAVNTVNGKPKTRRRQRGRPGQTAAYKKAIVTLEPNDSLDETV
ncbi:MAG: 50S ribosomal protein L23 [Chlamydiota bacterium]